MGNTALSAEGARCPVDIGFAPTEAERRQSTDNTHMAFANEEHEKFYYEKLKCLEYTNNDICGVMLWKSPYRRQSLFMIGAKAYFS